MLFEHSKYKSNFFNNSIIICLTPKGEMSMQLLHEFPPKFPMQGFLNADQGRVKRLHKSHLRRFFVCLFLFLNLTFWNNYRTSRSFKEIREVSFTLHPVSTKINIIHHYAISKLENLHWYNTESLIWFHQLHMP